MFKRLEKYSTRGRTAWMPTPFLGDEARLCLAFAGESNKPYFNELLRMGARRARRMNKTGTATTADLDQNRKEDRLLFPKHIILGWEGVEDDEGNLVEFTSDHVKELCQKAPPEVFDLIRDFAASQSEFYVDEEMVGN